MAKNLNTYTLSELQEMENFNKDALFDSIILVPMKELHDSGFRCMKGILINRGAIVGSVGGWCDVVHPNGIGNYGRYIPSTFTSMVTSKLVPYMGLSMDCLVKSGCIRLMLGGLCKMDDFIGSDLCFYKEEETNQ